MVGGIKHISSLAQGSPTLLKERHALGQQAKATLLNLPAPKARQHVRKVKDHQNQAFLACQANSQGLFQLISGLK
ncbi:hypothetical protein Y1Q_0015993 [Alligator mississippiensis]|uniref:Uncharacterized protein n=1 Tax=Alligator mississippiensis TaxID=8496 RepID=A0A151MV24_ALLMI|nr:hypothetical protein Y1Q_0015993 [Alligator mississippiensis]